MLTLHRASAGSGKTYALAKMFLRLLLSAKHENQPRRLRTDRELTDSLPHILAITFTNKATAEMKQRIISALSNLARFEPGSGSDEPDYYSDFLTEFHTTPQKLQHAALTVLRILLNNYSDFKVSTIDSFFQTVLRTFAYETNLQDNYGVEIETGFINELAIEAMMEAIDNADDAADIRFWFDLLMRENREEGKRWNVFQKSDSSFYTEIKKALQKFDSEDYKYVREALDRTDAASLRLTFEKTEEYYAGRKKELEEIVKREARNITAAAEELGFTVSDLASALKKAFDKLAAGEMPGVAGLRLQGGFLSSELTKKKALKELAARYAPLSRQFWTAVGDYHNEGRDWIEYRRLYPYLGLMQLARGFVARYLNDNNSIVLAETNSLLRRVISDDDTPFIYERLGARLNHLLIDEFQDTSRLQWENIRPLLAEPLARGEESLLIGDAKQSIYRFRNADPSIIMKSVPAAFPDSDIKGESEAENTNYRSDERIVEFNNYIFSTLPQKLGMGFESLYSNAVQALKNGRGRGYVKIETLGNANDEEETDDTATGTGEKEPYNRLGSMVTEMLGRGYRQKDIAFLVRTKAQGQAVIQALMRHNAHRVEGGPAIDFISEESLTISWSKAVATIVACLRNITSAASLAHDEKTDETQNEETDEKRSKRVDWYKIRSELSFFVASHPEMEPDRQIEAFFEAPQHTDILGDTVKEMQSTSLPALVEVLAATFVPASLRESDAPFLAAFQDSVLDYCSNHAADIGSFLNWWDLKGKYLSIDSPADTDAVQIMTVHKSKGIEFGVVIIPECDWDIFPNTSAKGRRSEWKWVKPQLATPEGTALPEYLPVILSEELIGTPHESDFNSYLTLGVMDSLNALYVAFTRAVNELYIFIPPKPDAKKPTVKPYNPLQLPKKLGMLIPGLFCDSEGKLTYSVCSDNDRLPDKAQLKATPDGTIEFGIPLSPQEISSIHKEKAEKKRKSGESVSRVATGYHVNPNINFLKYTEVVPGTGEMGISEVSDDEDADETDLDPRSQGNLMHAAMEWIDTAGDISKAVLRLKTAGLISHNETEHYSNLLAKAVESVADYGWFAESNRQVMNERPILQKGNRPYRPDRIMIDTATGKGIIVDYKFGTKALKQDAGGDVKVSARHLRQVRNYVKLLKETGKYTDVEGYLWYIPFARVVKV